MGLAILLRRLALISLLMSAATALAHDSRPMLIAFRQLADNEYQLNTQQPPDLAEAKFELRLQPDCTSLDKNRFHCATKPTAIIIAASSLPPSASIILRVEWLNGQSQTIVHQASEQQLQLPASYTGSVWSSYIRLGVSHILEGIDHLFFVLMLLLITTDGRKLLLAVTGFTIGHTITLVVGVLGFIDFNIAIIESLIALSIVFMAADFLRQHRSLSIRWPALVSTAFGMLHGLGFASALGEIGLPKNQLILALLGFNIGVEIGQLLFVAIVILVYLALKRLRYGWFDWAKTGAAVLVGVFAMFWFLQRLPVAQMHWPVSALNYWRTLI